MSNSIIQVKDLFKLYDLILIIRIYNKNRYILNLYKKIIKIYFIRKIIKFSIDILFLFCKNIKKNIKLLH